MTYDSGLIIPHKHTTIFGNGRGLLAMKQHGLFSNAKFFQRKQSLNPPPLNPTNISINIFS